MHIFVDDIDKNFIEQNSNKMTIEDIFIYFNKKYTKDNIRSFCNLNSLKYKKIDNIFSKEDKEFIKNNSENMTFSDMTIHFNNKYDKNQIRNFYSRNKLNFKKIVTVFSEEDKEFIKNNFKDMTINSMYIKLNGNITKKQIRTFCNTHNLVYKKLTKNERGKSVSDSNKFKDYHIKNRIHINENFFDLKNINENSAYVYGLFASDGNIMHDDKGRYTFRISLHKNDKYLLENVKNSMSSQHRIYYDNNKNMVTLQISCKKIVKDIIKLGGIPNKSLTLKFPEKIPEQFIGDFLRGVLDGDGSIYYYQKGKHYSSKIVSGSPIFLEAVMLKIKNIDSNISCSFTKEKPNLYSLKFSKYGTLRLGKILYKNNPKLKMLRKYYKFLNAEIEAYQYMHSGKRMRLKDKYFLLG